jgi:uncharacterized protein (DUF433 family)
MIQKRGPVKARKAAPFSARFRGETVERLQAYAERRALSMSAAAEQLLDEALRTQEFPGIAFRWSPSGERQPFLIGTGLSVWELSHMWDDHDQDLDKLLKNYPHLRAELVHSAIAYWKRFRREEPPGFWSNEPPRGAKVIRVKA